MSGPVLVKIIQDATPFSPDIWLTSYASILLISFCPTYSQSSFKANVKRIDICQKNPLPNYKRKPDFIGGNCVNLLNSKVTAKNLLNTNQKYDIPKSLSIENGNYRYISIIIENKFFVSGAYSANNFFWTTSKKGPKDIIQSKSKISNPNEFTTKLKNWRGKENLDNKYCKNNLLYSPLWNPTSIINW